MATAAEVLIDALIGWGVELVFGLPGDGIAPILEALRRRQDRLRFVQVRHEEAAAFMATGYAKLTGRLGVCLATSGPGGIHLLNGLYDAKLDGAPVLAVTGLPFHDLINTFTQQDVELDKLFMDVAVYNNRMMGPAHVESAVDLACRSALGRAGVAHLAIPVDVQAAAVASRDGRSERNVPRRLSSARAGRVRLPDPGDLASAAELLNAGRNVAILAGRGAIGCGRELEQAAERLGAPVVKALLGKEALSDESVYTTGGLGLLGTRPSQEAMERCDTLLIVGSAFPYIEFLPKPGQARAVQIDCDAARIGLRYPVEIGLAGDARLSLQALLPLLKRNPGRRFLERAQAGMIEWWEQMEQAATRQDIPMKPQVVAWELGKRLDDEAIVACDSGTAATWWSRLIPARGRQSHLLSGNLATMGCALPYAIAAQLAFPKRLCVAFTGDGALSMLMAEFATCVKHRLPVKVVVLRNDSLAQIRWEQTVFSGNPAYGCELQPIDFAAFARACGGEGIRVDDPAQCGYALSRALKHPGPVIVEAAVDPFEPPAPPKVGPKQARHFAAALLRGTPQRERLALTAVGRARELI